MGGRGSRPSPGGSQTPARAQSGPAGLQVCRSHGPLSPPFPQAPCTGSIPQNLLLRLRPPSSPATVSSVHRTRMRNNNARYAPKA